MYVLSIGLVSLDVLDKGALTSSMLDDAFYIIKKCVRRALSSSSVDGVCAMLSHVNSVLEQDFRELLYRQLCQGLQLGQPGAAHIIMMLRDSHQVSLGLPTLLWCYGIPIRWAQGCPHYLCMLRDSHQVSLGLPTLFMMLRDSHQVSLGLSPHYYDVKGFPSGWA